MGLNLVRSCRELRARMSRTTNMRSGAYAACNVFQVGVPTRTTMLTREVQRGAGNGNNGFLGRGMLVFRRCMSLRFTQAAVRPRRAELLAAIAASATRQVSHVCVNFRSFNKWEWQWRR